jgi:hypothetical protein
MIRIKFVANINIQALIPAAAEITINGRDRQFASITLRESYYIKSSLEMYK